MISNSFGNFVYVVVSARYTVAVQSLKLELSRYTVQLELFQLALF